MLEINTDSLSKEQLKFAKWLNKNMPFLTKLFDFKNRSYKVEMVDNYLKTASGSELLMAKFALAVWEHDDNFDFNFIDAVKVLDDKHIKVVTDWMQDPFWP